ncbi:hypothetical protein D3C81_2102540 [compost metagenome]
MGLISERLTLKAGQAKAKPALMNRPVAVVTGVAVRMAILRRREPDTRTPATLGATGVRRARRTGD